MSKYKTIHSQEYQSLIENLAKERIRLSVSQGELAALIGVNQSDISKIEKCDKRLDVLEFSRILKVLRVHENQNLKKIVKEFIGISE